MVEKLKMRGFIVCAYIVGIFFLVSGAVAVDTSELEELIESSGYVFLNEKASGLKQLSSDSYILRVYTEPPGSGAGGKSVIVIIENNLVRPIDDPVWAGDSVSFELLDINSDGRMDVIVNEYYEPKFHVRIFLNDAEQGLIKVLTSDSTSLPEFVEIGDVCENGRNIRELVLTTDPYGYWHPSLLFPTLYVFNGNAYIKKSTNSDKC